MARKPRTPPPPRVQAPKRRDSGPARGADARRQRMILYALAGSGIVLLGAVLLFLALARGGGDEELAERMRGAGCTFETFESEGRRHVDALDAEVEYKTEPPTSGSHFGIPAIWDIYDRPVNQLQAVHNLEHGGIVIQYGSRVPRATVDRIAELYREDPNGMLVAPRPRLGDKIALTAWTHLSTCTRFDEGAFKAFRDAYRGKGPEPFAVDDLRPGGT